MDIQNLLKWTDDQVFAKTSKHLDSLQKSILEGIWKYQDYEEIAEKNHRSYDHIKKEGWKLWQLLSDVFEADIKKNNVRSILENKFLGIINNFDNSSPIIGSYINKNVNICRENSQSLKDEKRRSYSSPSQKQETIIDLKDAPEINYNYGRKLEIDTLKEWLENKTKLITIYGLKGIGKTALVLKLISEINTEFDYIIYRSLDNLPQLITLKDDLKKIFSQSQSTPLSEIIDYFKTFRFLVILDDVQNIFKHGELAGKYLTEYQDYGNFFEQIATKTHQSCLILITQEKSPDIEILENNSNDIKTLKIDGLEESAKEILKEKGLKNEEKWEELINLYQTHPTWLKIISSTIKQLYNGDVIEFLSEENDIFIGDITFYLQPHLERLSELESKLIKWLARENQPVNIAQISTNLELSKSQSGVIIQSLLRRCLVEKIVIEEQFYYELNKIFKEYLKEINN